MNREGPTTTIPISDVRRRDLSHTYPLILLKGMTMTILRTKTSRQAPRTARLTFAAALGMVLVLAGCSTPAAEAPPASPDSTIQTEYGFEGMDAEQIVDHLDALPIADRPANLMAAIYPDELLLTDGKNPDLSLPMPEDKFYVSFAPYVDQTHECYFHSLTTCTGEMQTEDVQVTVTNETSGEVLIDEEMQTQQNGFVGLWLPRDIEATIDVAQDDLSASATVSTSNDDDLTCLTTMQLA